MKGILLKALMGVISMAIISLLLLSVVSFLVLSGTLPEGNHNIICFVIHFVAVYFGSLLCCSVIKEKKGGYAGIVVALWYAMLLFVAVVILELDTGNLLGSFCAGICAYGASLLSYKPVGRRGRGRKPKYHSR